MGEIDEFKQKLKTAEEYKFLAENEMLGKNVQLLALSGSRAYGTNLPDSDFDLRGFAMNPLNQIFGVEDDFEQIVDTTTDTSIYSFKKIVRLLLSCNPNVIEIFGCKPEHYLYVTDAGKKVLEAKEYFLSKKAIESFGGYATAQFNRLEHALLGNGDNDDKKLQMLEHSLNSDLNAFNSRHRNNGIRLSIGVMSTDELKERTDYFKQLRLKELIEQNNNGESQLTLDELVDKVNEEFGEQVYYDETSNEHIIVNGSFKNVSVTEFKTIIGEIHKIQSEYGNINKRNTKKTDVKLNKHMMHLIRLYLMGRDINRSLLIKTYRDGNEHDMLMNIRQGGFTTGDGKKVRPEFYELLTQIRNEYDYSVANTVLPDKPNYDAINELMLSISKKEFNI